MTAQKDVNVENQPFYVSGEDLGREGIYLLDETIVNMYVARQRQRGRTITQAFESVRRLEEAKRQAAIERDHPCSAVREFASGRAFLSEEDYRTTEKLPVVTAFPE